jgi:hypothetical protein
LRYVGAKFEILKDYEFQIIYAIMTANFQIAMLARTPHFSAVEIAAIVQIRNISDLEASGSSAGVLSLTSHRGGILPSFITLNFQRKCSENPAIFP